MGSELTSKAIIMMKIIVIIITLCDFVLTEQVSNTAPSEYENDPHVHRIRAAISDETNEGPSRPIPGDEPLESDITFWFFSQDNPKNGIAVNRTDAEKLRKTSFCTSRDTMFIIYGWQNSNESSFANTVRDAAVDSFHGNIFVVDWYIISKKNYITATKDAKKVGIFVADFINSLVLTYKLALQKVMIVGHSLGAHIAGCTGAALQGQIDVIVGLDPALPLYANANIDERLDPTDAQFVQVIHTNGGFKGFLKPIGDSDYYPNCGKKQPGCGWDLTKTCSHGRAGDYFAESLKSDRFIAVACPNCKAFSAGKCKSNRTSVMGTLNIDKSAHGVFYLDTRSESPFAKG